jgi:hypothetical protein
MLQRLLAPSLQAVLACSGLLCRDCAIYINSRVFCTVEIPDLTI